MYGTTSLICLLPQRSFIKTGAEMGAHLLPVLRHNVAAGHIKVDGLNSETIKSQFANWQAVDVTNALSFFAVAKGFHPGQSDQYWTRHSWYNASEERGQSGLYGDRVCL